MKKFFVITFLVVAMVVASFSLAMAKTEKVNLEGEIVAVDEIGYTITIRTEELEEFTIHFSAEETFSFSQADIGTFVHVKGEYQEDGSILAVWVKPVEEADEEGEKEDSAYCSGKKETAHPAIIVLANKYGKEVEALMEDFCDGFGIGQIYLALQTEAITGVAYEELLASRAEGKGWGEIWKELGSNGKPKDPDKTPPGQDKDKNKDKDDDEPKVKEKEKEKEKEKVKKPKKEK